MIYSTDIVIFGGGIAGLWLLSQLKKQGYHAILLESNTLGAGQTILSQGIIHGGTKYAIKQTLTPLAQHIKTMPARWQACLVGQGEVDLTQTKQLASHQNLWFPLQFGSQFVGFLASNAMRSRVEKLKPSHYPHIFQTPLFKGHVYSLNEPVLDVPSLLACFRQHYAAYIAKIDTEAMQLLVEETGIKKIVTHGIEIHAQRFIFTCGEQNEMFAKKLQADTIKTQCRPLRMLLIKSLPHPLYAHCVDKHFKPRLTITSYPTDEGYAWYIGGEIAEKGASMSAQDTYDYGLSELKQLFPWLSFQNLQWKTLFVNRAEPWQADGKIPAMPTLTAHRNSLFAWPVKLAYAPLLAQETIAFLQRDQIKPRFTPEHSLNSLFPVPEITLPPWQESSGWN